MGERGAAEDLQRVRRRFRQEAELLLQEQSPEAESGTSEDEKSKVKPRRRLDIHSVFWILASLSTTYYVEFFKVFKESLHEGSATFLCGCLFLVVSLSVAFYCVVYLEWYCGIADYDTRHPALVPITIATFIVASICYNVAFWPVWSFLTPLLLFTQFMGVVMLVSLFG